MVSAAADEQHVPLWPLSMDAAVAAAMRSQSNLLESLPPLLTAGRNANTTANPKLCGGWYHAKGFVYGAVMCGNHEAVVLCEEETLTLVVALTVENWKDEMLQMTRQSRFQEGLFECRERAEMFYETLERARQQSGPQSLDGIFHVEIESGVAFLKIVQQTTPRYYNSEFVSSLPQNKSHGLHRTYQNRRPRLKTVLQVYTGMCSATMKPAEIEAIHTFIAFRGKFDCDGRDDESNSSDATVAASSMRAFYTLLHQERPSTPLSTSVLARLGACL